jgi:hypothetical protein
LEEEDYKEILSAIILDVFGRIVSEGCEDEHLGKEVINGILNVLKDENQEELIESIVKKADEILSFSDPKDIQNYKIFVIGAIHFLKKLALKPSQPAEKLEEPKIKVVH